MRQSYRNKESKVRSSARITSQECLVQSGGILSVLKEFCTHLANSGRAESRGAAPAKPVTGPPYSSVVYGRHSSGDRIVKCSRLDSG